MISRRRTTERVVSPIDAAIDDLDGTYYKLSQVAQMLSVSPSTLRRMLKRDDLQAPSKELVMGSSSVYLYTEEDVEELRQYVQTRRDQGRWSNQRIET